MRLIVYALPVVAVLGAIAFRSSRLVRVCCVAVLLLQSGLTATDLLAGHRLLMEKGSEGFADPITKRAPEEFPADFMYAVDIVQNFNQGELGIYILNIGAFACLALLPVCNRAESNVLVS